jgi:hypothetical protein
MIKELLDIKDSDSLPEMCARFGEFLGLDKPVPMNVLLRAIDDPPFASDLITCRNTPAFLEALFNDHRNNAYGKPEVEKAKSPTSAELIGKAASAFINWGKAGFSTVDMQTLERREDACLECPNLKDPEHILQKIVPSKKAAGKTGSRTGKRVCALCGCNAAKKMRLPSEACPDKHPTLSGITRWGEPIAGSTN